MCFYLQVQLAESDEWVGITSSAAHMMELTSGTGEYKGQKLKAIRLPNGDVYSFQTKTWTEYVPPKSVPRPTKSFIWAH